MSHSGRLGVILFLVISSFLILTRNVFADFPSFPGFLSYSSFKGQPYNVSYDERAFLLNGQRTLLLSAGMHYPRSSPSMWDSLFKAAREGGNNMVQTYVFHNYHEETRGTWDWSSESRNLSNWLSLAAENDLFVMVRIGPYVCAEWFYGGIPLWNHDQGYPFRINSTGWENYVQEMVTAVVDYITPYLANNGGPVIALQIENEYGDANNDPARQAYIWFNGNLTQKLAPQIPWVMCQESEAPFPIIYACNGDDCEDYVAHQQSVRKQPALWTENWIGWFQHWGEAPAERSSANIATDILRYFAKGGVHQNMYMYHGGTNFGRTVGGPNIVTSYDYDGCLDEFGVPHYPKYSHIAFLYYTLQEYAEALVSNPMATAKELGNKTGDVEAFVYGSLGKQGSVTFLTNALSSTVTVTWQNTSYTLNPQSTCVIDGVSNVVVYDSSDVADYENIDFEAEELEQKKRKLGKKHLSTIAKSSLSNVSPSVRKLKSPYAVKQYLLELPKVIPNSLFSWQETAGVTTGGTLMRQGVLEQLNVTEYKTIYLWYITNIQITESQAARGKINISLSNAGDHEHFFINDTYLGTGHGASSLYTWTFSLEGISAGSYALNILSMTQGLNNGADDALLTGLYGKVLLDDVDLTNNIWSHRPFVRGEIIQIWTDSGRSQVQWANGSNIAINTPLTWYQVQIETPPIAGDPQFATWEVDMSGMTKGSMWANNFMLGSYWNITFSGNAYSQQFYHWPRDYLAPPGKMNILTVFEEIGGDPSTIRLIQRNSGD